MSVTKVTLKELATVQHSKGVVVGLAAARERLYDLLNRGSNEDLREVFNALAVELRVSTDGKVEVSLAIPVTQLAIDSAVPGHGLHNKSYPLRYEIV